MTTSSTTDRPDAVDAVGADHVHEVSADRLRQTRQRYTRGRRVLVQQLLDLDGPATIPELLDDGSPSSTSSLYRNLAILEQCGVVHRVVAVDDTARYELSEELSGHHHHLVCRECGRIADLTLTDDVEQALTRAADQASRTSGFRVAAHNLEMVGTCEDCAPEHHPDAHPRADGGAAR